MNKHAASGHFLAADLEKRLARVAERVGRTPSELIEAALTYFLGQVETDEEIKADLDERLIDHQQTGEHLTHEEVVEWLDRLANGEDIPPPKAHA
jgi:predicted transcriptional regulator